MTRSARRTPRPAVPRRQSDDARQAHGRIDRRESSPHALPGAARPFPTVRDHRIARFGGDRFGASSRQAAGQARPADSPKVTSRRQPFRTRRSFPSKSVGLCSACELALLSSSRSRMSSYQPGEPDSGAVGVAGHVGSCCCPSEERRSRTAPFDGRFRPETDLLAKGWPGCQVWFVPTDRTPASGIGSLGSLPQWDADSICGWVVE